MECQLKNKQMRATTTEIILGDYEVKLRKHLSKNSKKINDFIFILAYFNAFTV